MQRLCGNCSTSFQVTPDDLAFYDKVSPVFQGKKYSIPPPTLCPLCRLQRRLAFRISVYVYLRPAFPDGKQIFSMYTTLVPFPVMRNEDWMGDGWDPFEYGRDPIFSRPFFDQFRGLSDQVPHPALASVRNENCDYCNNLSNNKNCYLVFNTSGAEGCMYCENSWDSRDCIECTWTLQSELCYECIACTRCYNLQSSEFCEDCSDGFFLSFCRSCVHCFGCSNLRHREYCIFNEQKTKEEYKLFLQSFHGESFCERREVSKKFGILCTKFPRPHAFLRHTEDVSGNFIQEGRHVHESYFIQPGEDLRYCFNLHEGAKDCMDYSLFGRRAELIYESVSCGIDIRCLAFCYQCREGSSNLLYCWFCDGCQDCFGCISLRKKRYCILNRQYTKEEYEKLIPKIIEHMRSMSEWGEFFPVTLSSHPYNRSVAQRYFPLERSYVEHKGLLWYEEEQQGADIGHVVNGAELPDGLPPTDEALVVRSTLSGKSFKVIPQEIKWYRQLHVPLPRMTYDERMEERMKVLGGVKLYERQCARTRKPILTTYPADSPWIIWDRDVYEKEFGSSCT